MPGTSGPFAGQTRKVAPTLPPPHPGDAAGADVLEAYARSKAGALNQHVIGYGALAESEWRAVGLEVPDLSRMRRYRLDRLREQLRERDLAGIYLYDPINVRYATDSTNMQIWTMHNPVRAAWVPTEGPVCLFDFHHCEHLSAHSDVVDEVHPGIGWFYFEAGDRTQELAQGWAGQLASMVRANSPDNMRVAFDQLDPHGIGPLEAEGITVVYGEDVTEHARRIKGPDEILCMRRAVVACEAAMAEMEEALHPGMTENDLWSLLHAGNIRRGGEWIETRLLSSGPRTNPWFQESSARVIQDGDLVAFDTDLIGPYGYCCDISRTWLAGSGAPTTEQRGLYRIAAEQIAANRELLRPGLGFRDLTVGARSLPPEYLANRYSVIAHGVGLCDEYPAIRYPEDWDHVGYDGTFEAGMVVSVESYVGRHGGHEGVKLEDQVLITATGHEQLSTYPLDSRLLG